MVLLDNDSFLNQLGSLFTKTRTSGSVNVTLKKYNGQTKPLRKDPGQVDGHGLVDRGESRCLFRACNGKKKLSTVVLHKDVNKFQMAYATMLKAHMDGLKKREKKPKKPKTTKATQ